MMRKETIPEPAEQEQYLDGRLQEHSHTQIDDWGVPITNFIFSLPPAIWFHDHVAEDERWTSGLKESAGHDTICEASQVQQEIDL
jgi:hypothetical protein